MAIPNFNINDYTASMEDGDFARSNLFYVDFIQFNENFSKRCRSASFPEMSVGNIEIGYMGRSFNLGGDRSYSPWECIFFNDPSHTIRLQLIEWQDLVHSYGEAITGGSPVEYKKDVSIYQYKRNTSEAPTVAYMMVNAWPQNVGQVDVAWDSNNRVQEFPVQFRYDYLIIVNR